MSSIGDVTHWLHQLTAGQRDAIKPLLDCYFRRLVALARDRLRGLPRGGRDEEDLALSAFDSFCRRAEEGKFPRLKDSEDLWEVLRMIVLRKVCDLVQHEQRDKRDWRRTQPLDGEDAHVPIGPDPGPAEVAEAAEEMTRLLGLLPDKLMRDIALRKLEGYTNEEIKTLLDCSLKMVERRLPVIRKIWEKELPA
jgi:DNA-directed RNA polymerase specialized sigma24 family protein